jgi:hypothetical protein
MASPSVGKRRSVGRVGCIGVCVGVCVERVGVCVDRVGVCVCCIGVCVERVGVGFGGNFLSIYGEKKKISAFGSKNLS